LLGPDGYDVLADGADADNLLLDTIPLAQQVAWEDAVRDALNEGTAAPPPPTGRVPKLLRIQDLTRADLDVSTVLGTVASLDPWREMKPGGEFMVRFGQSLASILLVTYLDGTGAKKPWPPNKLKTLFAGHDHRGPGIATFAPPTRSTPVPLLFEVELYDRTKRRWRFQTVNQAKVRGYCNLDMLALGADQRILARILFAEGGSMKDFATEELVAVAWCIRNRVELIQRAHREKDARLLRIVDGWFKTKTPSYAGVILAPAQFKGVRHDEFTKMSKNPAAEMPTQASCERLQLCVDVARDVLSGAAPNPHAGKGHPDYPGCFFYITKADRAKLVRANQLPRLWDRGPFPAVSGNDKHFYYGMFL